MHDPRLPSPPRPQRDWALFLDVDGTLLDIAPTPASVVVPPDLRNTLSTIARRLDGALALVSGRALDDIDRLFAPLELAASGQHGAEIRRPGGGLEPETTPAGFPDELLPRLEAFARSRPGLIIENKGMTIAVHFRLAPEHREALAGVIAESLAGREDRIETLHGHSVFEVKPRGLSKRTAVENFMRAPPFAGRRPVFVGDDRTDEDGFAAARAQGGYAIRVGQPRETLAQYAIPDAAETRAWLAEAARSLV